MLAGRALHESKGYLQGAPFVRKELDDTVFVKHVAAVEFDTCLLTELTCVADRTQFLATWQSGVFG